MRGRCHCHNACREPGTGAHIPNKSVPDAPDEREFSSQHDLHPSAPVFLQLDWTRGIASRTVLTLWRRPETKPIVRTTYEVDSEALI